MMWCVSNKESGKEIMIVYLVMSSFLGVQELFVHYLGHDIYY